MDTPIELATAEQLISELMQRPTFAGIVIRVATDVTGELPRLGDPMEYRASAKLSVLNQCRVMTTAMRKVLDREAAR